MSELIDRQGVIDRLKKAEDVFRQNGAKLEANGIHYALELVESAIEIPTIEPRKERPKGEWIFDSEFLMVGSPYGSYTCSKCGMHTEDNEDNFCWFCGADMRKEADNE